jgi:hypothetical protein
MVAVMRMGRESDQPKAVGECSLEFVSLLVFASFSKTSLKVAVEWI